MRRKQFMQLVTMLRAELSISSDPSTGASALSNLKQVLSRWYESLYDEHEWPHLNVLFPRKAMQAGQRYYDCPDGLDFDKIEKVVNWWGGIPHAFTRGIGFEEYTAYSSDDDVRADPAHRWDVRNVDGKEMIEVWPIPASSGQAFQYKGKLRFKPLVDDDDICLLDDQLIVLHAAAELAPARKRTDINAKLAAAQRRYGITKANAAAGSSTVRVGLSQDTRSRYFTGVTLRVGR